MEVVPALPVAVCVSRVHNAFKFLPREIVCRHALFFNSLHACCGVLLNPIIGDTEIEEADQALMLAPRRVWPVAPGGSELGQFGCSQFSEQNQAALLCPIEQ